MLEFFRSKLLGFAERQAESYCQKRFHAFRLTPGSLRLWQRVTANSRPLLVALNHSSWWDPLTAIMLTSLGHPRQNLGVMEQGQLEKFGFFKLFGMTGVDPSSASSVLGFVRLVDQHFDSPQNSSLWITPQGRFCDPREPIQLMAGLPRLLRRYPAARALSVAVEYAFWQHNQPEIFVRIIEVKAQSRVAWEERLKDAMQLNAEHLAKLVCLRNPAKFSTVWGDGPARIHPILDMWLRMRGESPSL